MSAAFRPCPICSSPNWRSLYDPLIQCVSCGLVATDTNQYPIDPEIYDVTYFTQRNAYLSAPNVFLSMYRFLLDQLRPFKASGSLLDVGCGSGQLIAAANSYGYHASGCDVSEWATSYARAQGMDVRTGRVDELDYPSSSFDVVVINHTLEHIPDPVPFLTELHRILADDGVLAVGVPNFGSLFSTLMRARWAGLLPEQHYWHFTTDTLARTLNGAGFSVMRMTIEPHVHRHPSPAKDVVLRAISGLANQTHLGDSLFAIAVKA